MIAVERRNMKRKRYRFAGTALAVLIIGSAALAVSPAPVTLNLSTVSDMAAKRNLGVKEARQDVTTAENVVKEAEGYQRGKLGLSAEYLHLNDEILIYSPSIVIPKQVPILGGLSITPPPVEIAPQDLTYLTLEGGYPIYTGGKIRYAVDQAKRGVAAREALASDAESDAILNAERYYLGTLLTSDVVHVNEDALNSYREHLRQAEIAYEKGVVAKYDVIRAETAVKEQEKCLTDARSQYSLALAALRTSLALESDTPVVLSGRLFDVTEPLTPDQAQDLAMKNSRILRALDEKIAAQNLAGQVEKAGEKPQVAIIGRAQLLTGSIAQTDPDWAIGLQGSMELYDGGVRKARIEQRESERDRTTIERQSAADQIRLAIQDAYLDLGSARSALESAQTSEQLARESLRLAAKRFEVGTGTSLEVLDANVSLSAAQVGEYASLYKLDLAYSQLHRYLDDIRKVTQEVQK